MDINALLHMLHRRLANFNNEERILGPHKNLDNRTSVAVINIAKELAIILAEQEITASADQDPRDTDNTATHR